MIYLNNAATTYPKPQCVIDSGTAVLSEPPISQFRSSEISNKKDVVISCRNKLGELLNIKNTSRIYFTSGATDSLNYIINGLDLKNRDIIATQTEHNSVLRPLYNRISSQNIKIISCDDVGKIDTKELESEITKRTVAVFVNHCSNVTGMIQDIEEIGKITRKYGILFIVDASQSAGCIPIYTDDWYIDILIFAGHKSLFGFPGIGGFYIKEGIQLKPLRFGGTGKESQLLIYNKNNYEYEVGTQNMIGISTLEMGVEYVLNKGVKQIYQNEQIIIKKIYFSLKKMKNVLVYGDENLNKGPVISFNIVGLLPSDVAYILQNTYGIIIRTGFHCAPLIHEKLKTQMYGTVRISISDLTREEEIDIFLDAINQIQESL